MSKRQSLDNKRVAHGLERSCRLSQGLTPHVSLKFSNNLVKLATASLGRLSTLNYSLRCQLIWTARRKCALARPHFLYYSMAGFLVSGSNNLILNTVRA